MNRIPGLFIIDGKRKIIPVDPNQTRYYMPVVKSSLSSSEEELFEERIFLRKDFMMFGRRFRIFVTGEDSDRLEEVIFNALIHDDVKMVEVL